MLIDQTNLFAPVDKPVTPDVGEPGAVTVALPVITVQMPVPTDGTLPASVDEVPQTA